MKLMNRIKRTINSNQFIIFHLTQHTFIELFDNIYSANPIDLAFSQQVL